MSQSDSADLLSTSERSRDDELESAGWGRREKEGQWEGKTRGGAGEPEVTCAQRGEQGHWAACTARLNSRMDPATVLGNSSITQELWCWQKRAGYPVQNKPPQSTALCRFPAWRAIQKPAFYRAKQSGIWAWKVSAERSHCIVSTDPPVQMFREVSAAIPKRQKSRLWGFARALGTWTPK